MKNRVSLIAGLVLIGAVAAPSGVSAQQFPGTNSLLNSPATRNLMMTLGYAPNDYCGFYFFLSTKNTGQFSDSLLRALLPMCAQWPSPTYEGAGGGDGSDGTGSGSVGNSTGGEEGGGEGGSTGGGQGDAGWLGGGGTTGGGTTGGGETGWPGDGGTTNGGTEGGGDVGGGDPFGGGGAMASPEPVSLILLGTGLMGIGGFGAARRRRDNAED